MANDQADIAPRSGIPWQEFAERPPLSLPNSPRGHGGMRDFSLEVYFSRWEFTARHHLTASDSEGLSLAELLTFADAEDRRSWETVRLGYTDHRGALRLRQTIAAGYDDPTADDILCVAGAQEGIYAAMHALLGRDDHAIVVTPNYQSAETIPLGLSAVTGVALDPSAGWTL